MRRPEGRAARAMPRKSSARPTTARRGGAKKGWAGAIKTTEVADPADCEGMGAAFGALVDVSGVAGVVAPADDQVGGMPRGGRRGQAELPKSAARSTSEA